MYDMRDYFVAAYDRNKAVDYAHRWALKRNPRYYDFEQIGGDCTNFASQVIYAGSGVMNYTPQYGWYYIDVNTRTASWTGVNYLYSFLLNNRAEGPFAEIVDMQEAEPGDIVQLSFSKGSIFHHSPVIVQTSNKADLSSILVAAHTDNQDYYPLSGYDWVNIRFIHILGVKVRK